MKISVSGIVGSGKSTVSEMLAKRLGYNYYYVGGIMRDIAREKGISLAELGKLAEDNRDVDDELDRRQRVLNERRNNFVMDSRLGFYFIPDSYKVFLKVDINEAARRVYMANRSDENYSSQEEVKSSLERRMESERQRYREHYEIDFPNEKDFDLVIDTTKKTPEEVVDEILEGVKISTKPRSLEK